MWKIFKHKDNLLAKVNCGVVHKQSGSIKAFLIKKVRRARRFKNREIKREYYFKLSVGKLLVFIAKSVLILPFFLDSLIGYKNKKNKNWIYHPLITIFTLFVYVRYFFRGILRK